MFCLPRLLKKLGRQLHVPRSFAEQQTVSPFLCAVQHVLNNLAIAQVVQHDLIVVLSDGGRFAVFIQMKTHSGKARDHQMRKRALFRLKSCIYLIANTAEIHIQNRMMPVLTLRRSGQTVDVFCWDCL